MPSGLTVKAIFPKSVWALQSPDMGELPVGVPKSAGAGANVGKDGMLGIIEVALQASDNDAIKAKIKTKREFNGLCILPPMELNSHDYIDAEKIDNPPKDSTI